MKEKKNTKGLKESGKNIKHRKSKISSQVPPLDREQKTNSLAICFTLNHNKTVGLSDEETLLQVSPTAARC